MITTLREAYESSIKMLEQSGYTENEAQLCARLVLDHATGKSHAHLVDPHYPLNGDEFLFSIWALQRGEPLAHLLGKRDFYGLQFVCDNRALIPRPETELLVEHVVESFKSRDRVLVADLGTGSGCIAVSIAHSLPQAVVYATDLSRDALSLARENARLHNVASRIEFIEPIDLSNEQIGNWSLPLEREGFAQMFNCVVTNPPYIAPRDIEELPTQIKDFEPRLALDGGADGLDCYRQIAAQCGTLLTRDGFLLAELGAGQFAAVRAIFESHNWQVAPPIFDFAGHERVLRAVKTGDLKYLRPA